MNQPAHSKKSKRDFYKHILGSDSTLVNDDSGLERKLLDFDGDALFDADTPSAKDMSKTMADGVKSQQEGIVKLASAMAPIINKFDEVLVSNTFSLSDSETDTATETPKPAKLQRCPHKRSGCWYPR